MTGNRFADALILLAVGWLGLNFLAGVLLKARPTKPEPRDEPEQD